MKLIKRIGLLCLLSFSLHSCYRDNAASLYPDSHLPGSVSCDTNNVSYSVTIEPIFIQNCALPSCHAASSPLGGYVLDNYKGVMSVVLSGRLIGAISHEAGYSAMPKDAEMLSDCDIGLVTSWINQGAQNN